MSLSQNSRTTFKSNLTCIFLSVRPKSLFTFQYEISCTLHTNWSFFFTSFCFYFMVYFIMTFLPHTTMYMKSRLLGKYVGDESGRRKKKISRKEEENWKAFRSFVVKSCCCANEASCLAEKLSCLWNRPLLSFSCFCSLLAIRQEDETGAKQPPTIWRLRAALLRPPPSDLATVAAAAFLADCSARCLLLLSSGCLVSFLVLWRTAALYLLLPTHSLSSLFLANHAAVLSWFS